jgi:amidase
MSKQSWQEIAANKKQEQTNKLPKEWLIAVPPDSRLNVLSVPRECGLLSAGEIEITESSVDDLLRKLARKEWTSVQVTSAFYKRAIISHQVVRPYLITM